MRTSARVLSGLALASLVAWLPAPALAAPPSQVEITVTTAPIDQDQLQGALEVLGQARASNVLNEKELADLKGRLLGDRITLKASFNDAPLGTAILSVVDYLRNSSVRLSVVIPQQDLPRLNERHVSARLNHADPVATVRLLLDMVQEDEQGEWEVEYEESEGGTFVVRTHARSDDDDDDDDRDDRDDDDREELEAPRLPERPLPPPVPTGPRPWLGVQMEPAPAGARGVRISGLSPNGPAAQAGLRLGDVIVSLGGQTVLSPDDLVARLERTTPGQELVVEVQRADALMPVALRLKVGQRE